MAAPNFRITKQRMRNHFHYFWWQYLILVLVAIFGWNLIYTTTRYQSPEHLKVEWYYEGYSGQNTYDLTEQLMADLKEELFPEMEEVTFTMVGMDETYGPMQLMVWSTAGQGDLYMLLEDNYASLAQSGVMADLQPYVDDGTLNVEGIDLSDCYLTDAETGETYLVGIPTDSLTGFLQYEVDPAGKYMGLLINGGNLDNTVKMMAWFLDNLR